MTNKKFIVELNDFEDLTTDDWRKIYEQVRKKKLYDSKHDYGLKVSVDKIERLSEFRKKFSFKDHFWILLTNGSSHSRFYVHIDGRPDDGSPGGINWPLFNCDEQSTTVWVEPVEEKYFEVSANSFTLEPDVETRDIYTYNHRDEQPVLFRSDLWHYAVNETKKKDWRVIIKWELYADSWDDMIDEFKPYAKQI
jgi:hypothetical protein